MKAWLLPKLGSIDGLVLGDLPDPVPAEGEVVLAVAAAALNPADYYLAAGQYPARPPLPHVLGRDAVGTVVAVGPGVTGWADGEDALLLRSDVGVHRAGTLAEKVAVPAAHLVRVPPGWTPEQAAAAPLVYLTAWQALTMWDDLPPGGVVLVSGAGGGVGLATVHLAAAMGYAPVALSRGPDKVRALGAAGAHKVFDPNDTQWTKRLKECLGPVGRVGLVVDNVAGPGFVDLLRTLGENGRVSVVGRQAGPVPQFNTADLFFRRLRIGGVAVGTYTPTDARAAWAHIVERLNGSGIRPVIDRVFDFANAPAAFARLQTGPLGKVVVRGSV